MNCPDCGGRLASDGSHQRKDGTVMRHRVCACGTVCVTVERVVAVQRRKKDTAEAPKSPPE